MPSLDDLKAQRRDASAKTAHLQAALTRLRSLQRDVDTSNAALADFDADASEALMEWANGGGQGEPPVSDHLARMSLQRAVGRAAYAMVQSGAAINSLTEQLRDANGELQRINAKIEDLAFATLQAEHKAEVAAFASFVESTVRPRLAKLNALSAFYFEAATRHANSGREEQARALRLQAEQLTRVADALPDANPLPRDVIAATAHWSQRHAELTDAELTCGCEGQPGNARNVVAIGSAA